MVLLKEADTGMRIIDAPGKRKIILEIGCGDFPFPLAPFSGHRELQEGEFYIGVDRKRPQPFGRFRRKDRVLPKNMLLMQADAKHLPLRDASVDEVILSNVISWSQTEEHSEIFDQIARVLKQTGSITFVETYSPSFYPLDQLRKEMAVRGFRQENDGNEGDFGEVMQYSHIPPDFEDKSGATERKTEENFYIAKFIKEDSIV